MAHRRGPWTTLGTHGRCILWGVAGRWSLSRGRLAPALAAFENAVGCRPGAFRPLLRLARAYLVAGDLWRAHRTLAQARESNPRRFARVAPAWLEREGVGVPLRRRLLGVLEPPEPESEAPPRVPSPVGARVRGSHRVAPAQLPFGDCRDLDEYARFRAMPPISEGERATIDWDALLEDLLDG